MTKTALAIIASFGLGSLTASATELDLFLSWNSVPPAPTSADEALERWEDIRDERNVKEVSTCASAVREMGAKGDSVVLRRLLEISKNRSQPLFSRIEALGVACELADSQGARVIVERMAAYLTQMRMFAEEDSIKEREAKFRDGQMLLEAFFRGSARQLLDELPDHQAMLSLALVAYQTPPLVETAGPDVLRTIAKCRVPQEVIDAAIVGMIMKSRHAAVPEYLADRMSAAAFPRLRELVRSDKTPEGFHYGAARTLSHLGDEEIVPDLTALLPSFREGSESAERQLLRCLWRIEVQHPPEKLLAYVESTDLPEFRDWRSWAVRRARTLGVDTVRIREVILMHARNAPSKTVIERGQLWDLKVAGLELGILHEDDLPDVESPLRRPTP